MPLPRTLKVGVATHGVPYEACWAKTTESGRPGISVEQHCRTTGIIAGMLAEQCPEWLTEKLSSRAGVIMAALHDVGKVAPGFQSKCGEWMRRHGISATEFSGQVDDHAKIGQRAVQIALASDALRFWAVIVGAHHGRLKGDRIPPLCDGGAAWEGERRRLLKKLVHEFGPLPDSPVGFNDAALWFNAGLVTVSDWLASNDLHFPPAKILDETEIRERAKRQLVQIGFDRPSVAVGKEFNDLFPFPPNALQSVLAESVKCPGVYIVESSMGSGKTEGALMAAYNLLSGGQASGVYFALPTQTTSNRIHRRVSEFIERITPGAGTRLIHGGSWLLEKQVLIGNQEGSLLEREGLHDCRDWFASSRRALLAPFGVGTVDQALLGVVAAKHFFVRQFGLAGKVVILDEVHSYDLYTGTLLEQLVRKLRGLGATVIVLSATLTAKRRRELLGGVEADAQGDPSSYPMISVSACDRNEACLVEPEASRAVQISFKSAGELPAQILARAERGECVLWIRNTVNNAQQSYRELCGQKRVGGPEIALLHSRFPQFRREELENDWLERLGKGQANRPTFGCVLVSTQVAEQSVDIDADLLVTDLAPTDMLLQRLGRLWRHPRARPAGCDRPEVWIARPGVDMAGLYTASSAGIKDAFGKSAKVYAPYVLLRTYALWHERSSISLPGDIRGLIEATYDDPAVGEPTAWHQLHAEVEARKSKLQQAALANSNPWQLALGDEEGVQTRWNSNPTAAVLLVGEQLSWDTKEGARLVLLNGEACELSQDNFNVEYAKAIQRNLVKVPRWSVKPLICPTVSWLRDYVKGDVLVCRLSGEQLLVIPSDRESGLKYRGDLGVEIPQWQGRNKRPNPNENEDDDESYD